jgi:hypothetical protein
VLFSRLYAYSDYLQWIFGNDSDKPFGSVVATNFHGKSKYASQDCQKYRYKWINFDHTSRTPVKHLLVQSFAAWCQNVYEKLLTNSEFCQQSPLLS